MQESHQGASGRWMLGGNGASLTKNIQDCSQIKVGLQAEEPIPIDFRLVITLLTKRISVLPSVQTLGWGMREYGKGGESQECSFVHSKP